MDQDPRSDDGIDRLVTDDGQLVFDHHQLCDGCNKSLDDHGSIRFKPPERTVSTLDNACTACCIFRAAVNHYYRRDTTKAACPEDELRAEINEYYGDITFSRKRPDGWVDSSLPIYHVFTPLTVNKISRWIDWETDRNLSRRGAHLDQLRIPHAHSGSDECIQMLRDWLEDCSQGHPDDCREVETTLPSRVLDVGTRDQPVLRLWETGGVEVGRYCALSHCWGRESDERKRPLTTTVDTLAARLDGIPEDRLPKTFMDSVILARRLDIRYLWIDSLCIIQGDEDDWREQSVQMHTIYTNAYLVIAATSAVHSGEGFLLPRSQDDIAPFCCEFTVRQDINSQNNSSDGKDSPSPCRLHIRPEPVSSHHTPFLRPEKMHWAGCTESTKKDYPLMTRAWCLQERILATRIVHYEREEMVWECRSMVRCECTLVERETAGAQYLSKAGSLLSIRWADLSPSSTVAEVSELWQATVKTFVELDITNPADRLPAMMGLAGRLQQTNSNMGRYMCGLWERNILYDLTWVVRSRNDQVKRVTGGGVPSWSWACLAGVKFLELGTVAKWVEEADHTFLPLETVEKWVGSSDGAYHNLLGQHLSMSRTTPSGQPFAARLLAFDDTTPLPALTISGPVITLEVRERRRSSNIWSLYPCGKSRTRTVPSESESVLPYECHFHVCVDAPHEDMRPFPETTRVLCVWICSNWASEFPREEDSLLPNPVLLLLREVKQEWTLGETNSSKLLLRAKAGIIKRLGRGMGIERSTTDGSGTGSDIPPSYRRVGIAYSNVGGTVMDTHSTKRRVIALFDKAEVVTVRLV